jgi:hypothetical protein
MTAARLRALLVGLLLGLAISPLSAQERVVVGAAGGASIPVSTTGDNFATGWQMLLTAQYTRARTPFGGELSFNYHHLPRTGGAVGHLQAADLTADLILSFPTDPRSKSAVRVSLAGGLGGYAIERSVGSTKAKEYPFGVNGGGSFDLYMNPRRTAALFLDVRYHHIFTDQPVDLVPISVGLKFRVK